MKTNVIPTIITIIILFGMIACGAMLVNSTNSIGKMVDELNDRQDYHTIDTIDKIPIVSLKDGFVPTGTFMLGSGTIDGKDVYIYYTQNSDGGYIRNKVDADITTIYTDEEKNPYLIANHVETTRLHKQFIISYAMHVPNNTVKKTFTV
jgi:hypothetical protein